MQDNVNPPTVGQAANVEREKQFIRGVKEWKGLNVTGPWCGRRTVMNDAGMCDDVKMLLDAAVWRADQRAHLRDFRHRFVQAGVTFGGSEE